MMIRKHKTVGFLAVATALLLSACANQMEPAQQAIAGIDTAVTAASADASKYVPDQLAGVQAKLADLKASFDKKDYKAVLAGAPAVLSDAQGLVAAAATKKAEVIAAAKSEWTGAAASVPGLLAAVGSRIAVLSKSRHVPAGVDLAAAKSASDDATGLWSKAQAAFAAGNFEEASAAAKDVKAKAEAAATALQLKLPDAAPAAAAAPAPAPAAN